MTPEEAAGFLRISPKTLSKWRQQGRGPSPTKMGTRVAYQRATVMEWAGQQEIEHWAGEQLPPLKVTTRPYKANPNRQHVDIVFAHPSTNQDFRKRIVAPMGMDAAAALAWGEQQARELFMKLCKGGPKILVAKEQEEPKKVIITLKQWWEEFRDTYASTLKASTRDNYSIMWKHHIGPVLGDLPIDCIDKIALAKLHRHCKLRKQKVSTRNYVLQRLARMIRVAADLGILEESKVPKIKKEKEPKTRKKVYSEEEVETLIRTAREEGPYQEVLILLVTHGALRIGECAGVMWEDIDWKEGTIMIARNVLDGHLQDTPKGDPAAIPLSPDLFDALARLKQRKTSTFILPRKFKRGGKVIPHGSEKGLARMVTALQIKAGLEPHGPHMHRHTTLTHAAERRASPHALQALARHGDVGTTMRYYIHAEKLELARDALSALLGPDATRQNPGKTRQRPPLRVVNES